MIWKPDTCQCVLEYNGANSVANFVRAIKLCAMHAAHEDCHSDNVSKNIAVTKAHEQLVKIDPALTPDLIKWKVDTNRAISIEIPSHIQLTKGQKDDLVAAVGTHATVVEKK